MRYGQDDGDVGLYVSRLEDVWLWGFGGLKSSDALPFRAFQTPCLCVLDDWVDLICALFKV